jgi:hypothetical protein
VYRHRVLAVFATFLGYIMLAAVSSGQTCPGDCPSGCTSPCGGGCLSSCDEDPDCPSSPIVIDVSGHGFSLTSVEQGVDFDFFGTGHKIRVSWTNSRSDNAWLVLDRNHNGVIDNATEMFGNISPQPKSPTPNGFLALAVFDRPENGGNGDGVVDAKDAVYPLLRLWIDKNHNGVSEPDELFPLSQLDVLSISLNYTPSERVDEFGNRFRFRSTIVGTQHSDVDRFIYDVF